MEQGTSHIFKKYPKRLCVPFVNNAYNIGCYDWMCNPKSLKGLSFNSFDFRCLKQHGVEGSCEQLCTMSSSTH